MSTLKKVESIAKATVTPQNFGFTKQNKKMLSDFQDCRDNDYLSSTKIPVPYAQNFNKTDMKYRNSGFATITAGARSFNTDSKSDLELPAMT